MSTETLPQPGTDSVRPSETLSETLADAATRPESTPDQRPSELRRQGPALAGDLEQMALVDLLQSSANSNRSGVITLHDGSARGRLWLRDGRVYDALSEGTEAGRVEGRDAVFDLLGWSRGSFVVESGDPGVDDRIGESTSYLLLEGMRHLDEKQRTVAPEHAGLPEEPPPPSREKKAVHSGLLLLNVSASWVGSAMQEGLLTERLRESRDAVGDGANYLRPFVVDEETAQVAYDGRLAALSQDDVEPLVAAVVAWLRAFFERVERGLPGRFSLTRLAEMTEAHRDSLAELGFGPILGWNDQEDDSP